MLLSYASPATHALAVAGPSRTSARSISTTLKKIIKPKSRSRIPNVPVPRPKPLARSNVGNERVAYKQADSAPSDEQRAYFLGGEAEVEAEAEGGGVWGVGMEDWFAGEDVGGTLDFEPGRVVECRRQGIAITALVLARANIAGKPRLIILRQNGEMWSVSLQDVQFVMPRSLVPQSLADRCWSPELLEAWSRGEETIGNEQVDTDMMIARREVVMILRKVERETEKMRGRLLAPASITSKSGLSGAEALWARWAGVDDPNVDPESRTRISSTEAADFILAAQSKSEHAKQIVVKPNTLPAFAAHKILMHRPDLFWADTVEMWESGTFVVRSRAERRRYEDVVRWIKGETREDRAVLGAFIDKVKRILATKRGIESGNRKATGAIPEWADTDVTIIRVLLGRLSEQRSIQMTPYMTPLVNIFKDIDAYPGEEMNQAYGSKLLSEIGVIPPSDSLSMSRTNEEAVESAVLANSWIPDIRASRGKRISERDFWNGTELDSLREDFTSHKVWVIDDSDAKELDDGISIQRIPGSDDIWIHAHIADPTRFLPLDHPDIQSASFRGSAIYLPEGNAPLFSLDEKWRSTWESLSLGSSKEGKDGQGTVVISARIGADGTMQDTSVRLGWLTNPRVCTYAAIDASMGLSKPHFTRPFGLPSGAQNAYKRDPDGGGPVKEEEMGDLQTLFAVAGRLQRKRLAQSGMLWTLPQAEARIHSSVAPAPNIFNPIWKPTSPSTAPTEQPSIDYTVPTPSDGQPNASTVVAEIMIAVNHVVGTWCSERSIPVPFRGSVAPQQLHIPGRKTMTLEEVLSHRDPNGDIDPYLLMRSRLCFSPGTVGIKPLEHWIMGLTGPLATGYTRATSPLRRFDDFLVHWQIKSWLAKQHGMDVWSKQGQMLNDEEVITMIKRIEPANKKAKRAGINANNFWLARAVHSRLDGEIQRGIIGQDIVDVREPMVARIAGTPIMTGISQVHLTVYIPSLGMTLNVYSSNRNRTYEPGQEIMVRVADVQPWSQPPILLEEA